MSRRSSEKALPLRQVRSSVIRTNCVFWGFYGFWPAHVGFRRAYSGRQYDPQSTDQYRGRDKEAELALTRSCNSYIATTFQDVLKRDGDNFNPPRHLRKPPLGRNRKIRRRNDHGPHPCDKSNGGTRLSSQALSLLKKLPTSSGQLVQCDLMASDPRKTGSSDANQYGCQ